MIEIDELGQLFADQRVSDEENTGIMVVPPYVDDGPPPGMVRSNVDKDKLLALGGGTQPRDRHGRWTKGVGGGAPIESGGGSRKGMGDIPIAGKFDADFKGGSAEKHLVHGADGSVSFTPERQKLHDQIVNDTLAGHERSDNPTYTVLGGGPASGKSSMVKAGAVEGADKSITIDPDQMKARLPEYQEGVKNGDVGAASYVHEESSYLAYRVQQASFERGINVTLDGCGDSSPAKMLGKVSAAKAAGYRVHAAYATVPTNVAIERATARAQKTGRWISPTVIAQTHASVSDVFPDIMDHFDDVKLYNTVGSPKLILSGGKGYTTIHDQGEWERFIGKKSSPGGGG